MRSDFANAQDMTSASFLARAVRWSIRLKTRSRQPEAQYPLHADPVLQTKRGRHTMRKG